MKKALLAASAVALLGGLASIGVPAAGADPVATAFASGYGANLDVLGEPTIIEQEGLATATVPPGQDVGPNAFLLVPVDPVVLSGTVVGQASAHVQSDLLSTLTVEQQGLAGPYNAVGVGFAENVGVLLNAGTAEIPVTQALVSATAVRAEAVGVCVNGTPQYDATSEVVDLRVGETQVDAVNDLVAELLDTLNTTLEPLAQVVDIGLNERIVTAEGASVNALRVTVLSLLGEPLAELIVGHAEVGGLTCAPDLPECSDGVDNDGDGVIDAQDPGCLTPDGVYDPNDDDERNECIDEVDNDGDGRIDFGSDPGCSSPQDDDERDGGGGVLARTGGDTSWTAPVALALAAAAIGTLAVRRRSLA